jgi:rhamnosyltransferase
MTESARECSLGRTYGVVVTFFPPGGLLDRLGKIARSVDQLIVIDNSASLSVQAMLAEDCDKLGAQLLVNPENVGIATALNQGTAVALENEASWIFFFDQDTEPQATFRDEIGRVVQTFEGESPLGIIGCNYYLSGSSQPRYPTENADGKCYSETTAVITSGSACSASMMKALGLFKDDYFIDCVDTEYCWRARSSGYSVCITTKPLLRHTIGSPLKINVLGLKFTTLNHSAFRRYFIGRNNILLFREYFLRFPKDCLLLLWHVLRIAIKLCAERNRAEKMRYLALGVLHGLLGRAGRLTE